MRELFTYHLLGFLVVCLLIIHPQKTEAQWTLDVMGSVKKEETKKRMAGATITIKRNGSVWKTLTSPDNGKFQASLLPDAVYVIEFSKPGHVTKRIELSTRNVPPDDAKYGFDFPMEMNLFEEVDGLDVSILNKPIAKVAFNPETGYMDYDPAYTKSIQKELDRLKKELAERLKQLEAERKAKQKSYDEAIALADKAFNAEKWEAAKPHYEKAASIFPDESYPEFQLGLISDELAEMEEINKRYKAAIERGDAAYKEREWQKSITAYKAALDLKEEQYPENKIKEIETIIANEEKVNEQYNEAIAAADQALSDKEYDKAKENYNKAIGLKDYEQYPKDKINEIDGILADIAEKEKAYTEALAQADSEFGAKEYQKSIDNYKKALAIKPEESYPKEKIDEANTLLENIKQLQADYDRLIADADAAFGKKEYDDAKSNYEEASNIFSNEQYPKEKIAEIAKILADAAKLEEDYNLAIEQGDKAFDKSEYEPSKTAYEKALSLKPDEEYPKTKLEEIKSLLEELAAKKAAEEAAALAQKELDDKYNAFIKNADAAFGSKNYDNAVENYESALEVKSEEEYPKEKIEEIKELLAELERKKEEEEAAALAQKELDEKYQGFITMADKAFNAKTYDEATENYNEALGVKPSEQYPKDRIKEIEDLLAAIERKKEEDELAAESERKKREYYEALIAEADAELNGKNYSEAEAKYNQALGVIPGEKYPQDKIKEIKDILAKIKADKENEALAQKQLEEKYKKLIAEADNAFGSEDYSIAKTKYKAALNVKSEEVYPQSQLNKIDEILAEIARKEAEIQLTNNALKQKQEQYNAFIKIADQEFEGKRYEKAIASYEQALGIMPDKTYPKEKIDEINQLLAAIAEKDKKDKEAALAEKEKRKSYEKLIYDGDRAMKLKEYKSAQSKFNAALNLYPDEKYPSEKLTEILALLNAEAEEPVVAVSNNTNSGSRAKINDANEREIEARMAKLRNKSIIEKDKALQKDKNEFENQEEIRISGGIARTNKADKEIDKYVDDFVEQTERGNKYHIANSKTLLATTTKLEKAEANRIKNADKKRNKADAELEKYTKEELAFKKEQDKLSKDKMRTHYKFADNVTESKLMMIERGDKLRENNRKDVEKLIKDTEKNKARNKKRREDRELDVKAYKNDLAKEEEIRISASVDRTTQNNDDLQDLADEMTKQKIKKSNYYKLNVKELTKFKERIDELESQRIKNADKVRADNQKISNKYTADIIKNTKKQEKKYYKDVKQLDKFRKQVNKGELANQKQADKRRVKSDKQIVKAKEVLGVSNKSQDRRYKEFKEKLDKEKKQNDEFHADLQAIEQKQILLANAELDDFYIGEKRLKEDVELAKKYPQGITEETKESGNSITIVRTKVTGNHVDVYERVFYAWGGTYFYKNGVNITQSLWDKESID